MTSISQIDHIAIACTSIEQVRSFYEKALGFRIDHIEEMPKRGIRVAFIKVGEVSIELIEPLREDSEVSAFLQKRGPGLHHIAFKSSDIKTSEHNIKAHKARLLYEESRPGAHNTLVNFIHPSSTGGVLMEIVE